MNIKTTGKLLIWLRIIIAAVFIGSITLGFISRDFEFIPHHPRLLGSIQLGPALLRTFPGSPLYTFIAGALAIIILTLLFGRVFCSMICPFGILQDIISFIGRKIFRKKKFKPLPSFKRIRIVVLGGTVICVITGFLFPVYLLEPFANFGRIVTALFVPTVIFLNNLAVSMIGAGKYIWLAPIPYPPLTFSAFAIATTALLLISIATILYGRIFCNTLCPVGALLSFISRYSLFRISISTKGCGGCSLCSTVCKSGCIDFNKRQLDNERCVMCFNCLSACNFGAIKLTTVFNQPHSEHSEQPDISRRNFLIAAGATAAVTAVTPAVMSMMKKKNLPVMPPGAYDLDRFQGRCISCHLCVSSCPSKIIKPANLEYGLAGIAQPLLDFSRGICEFDCTTCSNVCPTGALTPLKREQKKLLQIGRVEYSIKHCVVYTNQTPCGACAERCPTGAVIMKDWKDGLTIPVIDASTCIGCGSCENICPAKPRKAIIVKGVEEQLQAEKPKLNDTPPPGFPF